MSTFWSENTSVRPLLCATKTELFNKVTSLISPPFGTFQLWLLPDLSFWKDTPPPEIYQSPSSVANISLTTSSLKDRIFSVCCICASGICKICISFPSAIIVERFSSHEDIKSALRRPKPCAYDIERASPSDVISNPASSYPIN